MAERKPQTPAKIAGDCVTTIAVLGFIMALFGSALLNGCAATIQAFGDGMRWLFG